MQEEVANLVHPILRYGLRLRERLEQGESPLLEVEQATLKGLLLTEGEARRLASFGGDAPPAGGPPPGGPAAEDGRGGEQFLGARYALVCWLDELFTLGSPWAARWNERKLEAALYGTNDRAWRFWEQARAAETRAESDALEVSFLCVMLGFAGDLREQPDKLEAWAAAAQARLVQALGHEWAAPPELDPPTHVPPLRGQERLQRLVLVGGIALLLLLPVATFVLVRRLGQ
jgi:type IV/VI secretion system ImpK/VasF family protein